MKTKQRTTTTGDIVLKMSPELDKIDIAAVCKEQVDKANEFLAKHPIPIAKDEPDYSTASLKITINPELDKIDLTNAFKKQTERANEFLKKHPIPEELLRRQR